MNASDPVRWRLIGTASVLLVAGCGPTQVLPLQTAPSAVEGLPYEFSLNLQDGSGAHTYRLEAGPLPPGLRLHEDGVLFGTPTRAGRYRFTLSATGAGPHFLTSIFDVDLTVVDRLRLDADPPDAQVGVAYEAQLTATGGTPPYSFEVVGLPAGLDFDGAEGTLSGTPINDDDSIPLQITVFDSGTPRQEVTEVATLRVRPEPVVVLTGSLPEGQVGTVYSQRLQAEGGRPPYDWAVIAGVLPPGLRLGLTDGRLSGIPTAAGVYEFTIQVRDDFTPAQSTSQEYVLEINAP